jgi:predicted NUDIX family phosphoesterase
LDLKQQLEEKIKERDLYPAFTSQWSILNKEKAEILERIKPSTEEAIIYFDEKDLYYMPNGFSKMSFVFPINYDFGRRSLLEYNPTQRHPIPYCIVRYKNKYFFTLREKGSGELRLIGKKGLVGGHVGFEDIFADNLQITLMNGLSREIEEEAGVTTEMIKSIQLHGLIKDNEDVNSDHLAYVFEVELNTDKIKAEEEGVLSGIWIDEKD